MADLLTALGLVLVIEGSLYALAPDRMRAALRAALELPPEVMRVAGLIAAISGVVLVWLIRG